MNELEKRAKHHSKFQKGCLFPFGSAQGCAESLTESANGLHGGDGDVGKIVQFKKSSKKYKPGKFEIEEAFVKVCRGYTEYTYTLKCYPHDTEFGTRYHMVDIDDIEAVVDSSNNSLSEARKNLMTKCSKMLSEAVERGIKVYEVEKDGPPEVGRQIIAFVDSHEEYTILTRQDKEYVNKQNWDDKEGHKSSDGEYYAGKNGWIYSLGYSKYIYVDELDLVPQRHFDKIAKEQQAASERKEQIINKLVSIYGEDLGHKLSALISVKKDNRRVELSAYDSYLIEVAKHSGALKGLYESLIKYFDEDTVKKIIMMSPTVKAQYARDKYELPLPSNKTVKWNDYLSAGYLASEANGYLILKRISPKEDLDSLKIQLKNKGILEGSMDIFSFARKYKVESLELSKLNERWSDDALDELSKKPKDEWTEADWDTYNYCKNANAERDYYDSLDESSSDDYYNHITKMKTADSDNRLVDSEESIEDFVKRVTSGNDSIHYVADKIEKVDDKYYLVGFKSDMSPIEFLLGTPGEDASEHNVKHILKNPHWHISLSLKDELASMYLEKDLNESAFKSGDRYYGGLPAEPDYKGPGKDAKYHKEVTEYFLQLANTHPEYRIKGRSPISIVIETPYGIKNIDLTKFDSCEDGYDAVDAARDQLFESKKKNKGVYLNKDAGNVEHNVGAFNHAMSASESPSTNPCGPMGESVGTKWVNFYYNGKKIGGYTAAEEFDGEREDTLSLLAYDNSCDPDDIEVRIENDASNIVKEDFAKTKDYEYYKVSVPSPSSKGTCSFGVHEHSDGHCSISGIHPYDDGDYHWATSKDGITFNIYVGNPGKLVKKFVSEYNGYEDICSELAKLDKNVKSVMVHW